MTAPAKGHQVIDRVFGFGTTHSSGVDVMDVYSSGATDLTGVEVGPAKMIYVDLGVLLHFLALIFFSCFSISLVGFLPDPFFSRMLSQRPRFE